MIHSFLVGSIALPVILPLNCPLFLQNDDGPDVRAGSGDILLVHATETERRGTPMTPTLTLFC